MKRVKLPDEEASFEMAPMIDMVFLLLIFFMCASTFPELAMDRSVHLPVASDSVVPKNKKHPMVINIRKDGTFCWGTEPIDLAALAAKLSENVAGNPEEPVYIRADLEAEHRPVREAVAACSKAGAGDIIFATVQTP